MKTQSIEKHNNSMLRTPGERERERNYHGAAATIEGIFVFGSSLVDNGNNNFLKSTAKADYLPYGIDFPSGLPSGRFTNGKNVIDLLGEQLMLPSFIPPFKDRSTKGSNIVHGVNHASGSSGILDDTGFVGGNIVISLSQQIRDFEEVTLPELEAQLACNSSQSLPRYLFVVGVGGNDYMFNYFLKRSYLQIDLQTFTATLIASLAQKLKKLYILGGRKFVVMSINPLGYSPVVNRPNYIGSPQALNQAAHLYNTQLRTLLDALKSDMPDFSFALVNTYNIITNIIQNPKSTGGNGVLCERGGETCENRNRTTIVFFDGLHPTEALNVQIATKAYTSTHEFHVYPINVKQLAQL
ncbi:unnamed protein product [Malus baccata var. baccata]